MEQTYINSCILEEEINQMFLEIKPIHSKNNIAKVSHQSKSVRGIYGTVRLGASPYYNLMLETGTSEQVFILPLTLVDTVKHLCQWISIIDKQIFINLLLVVCEKFDIFETKEELQYVNLIMKWEDITVLGSIPVIKQVLTCSQQETPEMLRAESMNSINNRCRILTHHVSMPFYVDESSACCILLISYTNYKYIEEKLWLVLRAEQITWREFIVPNREYLIEFPTGIDKYYFDKFHKSLDQIFSKKSRELKVIFHHKEIFSTLNGAELPFGSNIFLTSNTDFSTFVHRFVKDPFSSWYSVDEADHASGDLITFYGQVDTVIYNEEDVYKSCYLCIRSKPVEPVLTEPQFNVAQSWMNPWQSQLSMNNDGMLQLPSVKDHNSCMKTGVPGKLVQIIKLRDVISGNEKSVYIKHSYNARTQQLFRLTSGIVICISHLNRRCSKAGKYYYISTILSNFKILSFSNSDDLCNGWGTYGLRHLTPASQDKMWGVVESINLTKVAITAKCSNCTASLFRGTCSKECSAFKTSITSAYAISWLQIIHNENSISMEKVLFKDKFVQQLLCIPEDIWTKFLKAAAEEKIVYLGNYNHNTNEFHAAFDFNELLRIYCSMPKSKGKFYICIKRMISQSPGKEPFYYCVHLQPVNKYRLSIVAGLARNFIYN